MKQAHTVSTENLRALLSEIISGVKMPASIVIDNNCRRALECAHILYIQFSLEGFCLHAIGGWLHVHCNVLDKEELPWKVNTVQFFKKASMNIGREWKVEEVHCERVKW